MTSAISHPIVGGVRRSRHARRLCSVTVASIAVAGALVAPLSASTTLAGPPPAGGDAEVDPSQPRDQSAAASEAAQDRLAQAGQTTWSIGTGSTEGVLIVGRETGFWLEGSAGVGDTDPSEIRWDFGSANADGVRSATSDRNGSADDPAVTHTFEERGPSVVSAIVVAEVPAETVTFAPVAAECGPAPTGDEWPAWSDPMGCTEPFVPVCAIGDTLVAPTFDPETGAVIEAVRCQGAAVELPAQRLEVTVTRTFDIIALRATGTTQEPAGGSSAGEIAGGGATAGGVTLVDFPGSNGSGSTASNGAGSNGAGSNGAASATRSDASASAIAVSSTGTNGNSSAPGSSPLVDLRAQDPRSRRPRFVVDGVEVDEETFREMFNGGSDAIEPGPIELELPGIVGDTIIGYWNDDSVTIFGDTRDAVVHLGAGQDRLLVFDAAVSSSVFELADGNDTVRLTNVALEGTTLLLGHGTDSVELTGTMTGGEIRQGDGSAMLNLIGEFIDTTIDLGGDSDELMVTGVLDGTRLITGTGNDVVAVLATTRGGLIELGEGEDEIYIDAFTSGLRINLGPGLDKVALGEAFRGDLMIDDPARSSVSARGGNMRDNDQVILEGAGWIRRDGDSVHPTFVRLVDGVEVARVVLGSENIEVVATTAGEVLLERQPNRRRGSFFGRLFGGLAKVFQFIAPVAAVLFPPAAVAIGIATGAIGLVQGVIAGCLLCAIGAAASFVPGVGALIGKGVGLIQGVLDKNFIRGITGLFSPTVAKIGSAVEWLKDGKPIDAVIGGLSALGTGLGNAAGRTIERASGLASSFINVIRNGPSALPSLFASAVGIGRALDADDEARKHAERLTRLAEIDPLTRRIEQAEAERSATPTQRTHRVMSATDQPGPRTMEAPPRADFTVTGTVDIDPERLRFDPADIDRPPVRFDPDTVLSNAPSGTAGPYRVAGTLPVDPARLRFDPAEIDQFTVRFDPSTVLSNAPSGTAGRYRVVGRLPVDPERLRFDPADIDQLTVRFDPATVFAPEPAPVRDDPANTADQPAPPAGAATVQRFADYAEVVNCVMGATCAEPTERNLIVERELIETVVRLDPNDAPEVLGVEAETYRRALQEFLSGETPAERLAREGGFIRERGLLDYESPAISFAALRRFLDLVEDGTTDVAEPESFREKILSGLTYAAIGFSPGLFFHWSNQPKTLPVVQRFVAAGPPTLYDIPKNVVSYVTIGGGVIELDNEWVQTGVSASTGATFAVGAQHFARRVVNPTLHWLSTKTPVLGVLRDARSDFLLSDVPWRTLTSEATRAATRLSDTTAIGISLAAPMLTTIITQALVAAGIDPSEHYDLQTTLLAGSNGGAVGVAIRIATGKTNLLAYVLPALQTVSARSVGRSPTESEFLNVIATACGGESLGRAIAMGLVCDIGVAKLINHFGGGTPPPTTTGRTMPATPSRRDNRLPRGTTRRQAARRGALENARRGARGNAPQRATGDNAADAPNAPIAQIAVSDQDYTRIAEFLNASATYALTQGRRVTTVSEALNFMLERHPEYFTNDAYTPSQIAASFGERYDPSTSGEAVPDVNALTDALYVWQRSQYDRGVLADTASEVLNNAHRDGTLGRFGLSLDEAVSMLAIDDHDRSVVGENLVGPRSVPQPVAQSATPVNRPAVRPPSPAPQPASRPASQPTPRTVSRSAPEPQRPPDAVGSWVAVSKERGYDAETGVGRVVNGLQAVNVLPPDFYYVTLFNTVTGEYVVHEYGTWFGRRLDGPSGADRPWLPETVILESIPDVDPELNAIPGRMPVPVPAPVPVFVR